MQRQSESLFIQSLEDSKIQDTSNENPSAKTTEDFPIGHEVQAASGYELTSSQVNTNQSIQTNPSEYNHHENDLESNEFAFMETKAKQTPETKHEFVKNVPDLSSIAISSSHILQLIYICILCSV